MLITFVADLLASYPRGTPVRIDDSNGKTIAEYERAEFVDESFAWRPFVSFDDTGGTLVVCVEDEHKIL